MSLKVLLLMLTISVSFSQSIIWEREYDLPNFPTISSLIPTLIDTDGNIVSVIDACAFPFTNAYFFKYDTQGNILFFNEYYTGYTLIPVSLNQTASGYKIFCAANNKYDKFNTTSIPLLLNTLKNGDSSVIELPYDLFNEVNYDTNSFKVSMGYNNNTMFEYSKFFNVTVRESIKIDSVTSQNKDRLIITCFDSSGKVNWKNCIDTLPYDENYYFTDLKKSRNNNFVFLSYKFIDDSIYKLQIIEFDTIGNITKKIKVFNNGRQFVPRGIEEINNGDYLILGQYSRKPNGHLIVKVNNQGEILKKLEFQNKNLKENYNAIYKTPKNNFIILGNSLIDSSSGNLFFMTFRVYLFQLNSNMEFVSDIEWYDHIYQNATGIRHIHFLDSSNFIGIGYKDRFKYYIVKFIDSSTTNVSDNSSDNFEFEISPNPVSDYLQIKSSSAFRKIEIFSTLGIKVLETVYKDRIDVSGLCSGVYFVKVADRVVQFVKM